jgi:hypothetical protein
MEEREKAAIFLIKRAGMNWWSDEGDIRALHWISVSHIKERYVDELTDKQREALIFIRMLPEEKFVRGIGAWVNSKVQHGKVYVIDC